MKTSTVLSLSCLLFTLAGGIPSTRADTVEAMCEVRKDGEEKKKATGPCTFSQRQGYVDIVLRNGDRYSLAPTDKPNHYKDQAGHKVSREMQGADHVYKWEQKRIIVSF